MHGFANPARFLRIARWLTPLLLLCGIAVTAGALALGLLTFPPEWIQKDAVYIILVHVPPAWLGMAGWMAIAVASLVELVWRHPLAGIAARAAALPGAVFTAICLITGSLWGRPTWGAWWVWDLRLTSMLLLLFLYFGYMALAGAAQRDGGSGRVAAIFGMLGAINIPIIHYSVIWLNLQHQRPSLSMGNSAIDTVYLWPLLGAMVGFSLIFGGVVLLRMRAILADQQANARLRRKAMAGVGAGAAS
ncbi:MAG: cytochrome c biogenesis protein CcsA [Sphingomonadaceae bacterium]|nr:cytochrome c biogenesis protein CcsA [Sphingomonadaceae bacterium]